MDVLERRLRSHRLSAPARSVVAAAEHMLAVQAQEFWGGRWALGVRTAGAPTLAAVDAAFDRGDLVRAWTQRGTIHVIPARDLGWVLSVTAERQLATAAPRHRELGLDAETLARAERAVRAALSGSGRLTRAELMDLLGRTGIDPAGQRGIHVLHALSLRGVVVSGPVVPRPGGPTREQYVVLAEDWIRESANPADPLAELFVRYVVGHGPATARDLAWWAGLPLGTARTAAAAAGDRVVAAEGDDASAAIDPAYVAAGPVPRRSPAAHDLLALPPFEESYISYVDRTVVCDPAHLAAVGPGKNGMVKALLVAHGRVVGTWTHSHAVGRHTDDPVPALLAPGAAPDADVAAALDRYRAFVTG